MAVKHSTLTGASLHEPKGVAATSVNFVYVANGSGSGTWQKIAAAQINTSSIKNSNIVVVGPFQFENISTASSQFFVPGLAGDITKIYTVIDGAIATANCGITFEIGGTLVTSGAITITQSGSAAGNVDSSTPSGANTLTAGQALEVISSGASTNDVDMKVTILMDVA
jgi:hypothetical protein|tara:strand:+ start:3161 stop:3664 length:504 start_codon:yes stop_codon:yes gene_type:complete